MWPRAAPLLVCALAACRGGPRNDNVVDRPSLAVPSAEPRGGGPFVADGALNLLARARCEREVACGLLGENRSLADREGCERIALQAHADDLRLLTCRGAIDARKVVACADNLRAVPCNRDAPPAAALCAPNLCEREPARGGGPSASISSAEARTRVAEARCAAREACGEEEARDACLTRVEAETALRCAVDPKRLAACLSAIGARRCSDTSTPAECADVCVKEEEP